MQILIFANNYQQARLYAKDNGLRPGKFSVVIEQERLMGLDPEQYSDVFLDGWEDNADVKEAVEYWKMKRSFHG